MALRTFQTREENNTLAGGGAGKNYYGKPVIKPRAALGSLIIQRDTVHTKKPAPVAIAKPKDGHLRSGRVHIPTPRKPVGEKSPEVEEMEVVTADLSKKLCIASMLQTVLTHSSVLSTSKRSEYMMMLEKEIHVPPTYMDNQTHVNSKMRAILIDWLIKVHDHFALLQETLYLTISIIDRFLAAEPVEKSKLQLVGVTCMLVASKYEEMYAPEVRDFVIVMDDTHSSEEIRAMERRILKVLDYSFDNPLCLHFLGTFSRAGEATPEVHTMGGFLMELCLPDYQMLEFTPSTQASAALYISKLVYGMGGWTPTLKHYTTYSEEDILPCASRMAKLVQSMDTAKQQAVRNKYKAPKFMRVSKMEKLHSQAMKTLASKT